jgi:excisionase family DNA binding protein
MQGHQEAASKPQPLLDRGEAAAYLGVSPNTLAVWACTKRYELPFIRVGRLAKYRLADLNAWLEQRVVSGAE